MKKCILKLAFLLSLFMGQAVFAEDIMDITRQYAQEVSEAYRPKSSIVVDAQTGEILFGDQIDLPHDPASMSKLMTVYLVLEAISQQKLSYDTVIMATLTDQAIAKIHALSNNNIQAGVGYKVSDLLAMTLVPSSNVATVMLANHLSNNDPDAFIDQMNAKSQEFGMTSTYWYNASGAEAAVFAGYYQPLRYDNYAYNETTARDFAILTYHLVNQFPDLMTYTNKPTVTVLPGTPYEETFHGYNHSVPGDIYALEGVDGLKTGSSPHAAYNYVATIKRGDHRLLEVILGVSYWDDDAGEFLRHPIGNALFEKAYADYEYKKLLTAGIHEIDGKRYQLSTDFYGTIRKGEPAVFTVENNRLSLKNNLESVSPLIDHYVAVEPVVETLTSATKEVIEKPSSAKSWARLLIENKMLYAVPVLILGLIILLEWRRRKKQQQQVKMDSISSGSYSRRKHQK